MRSKALDGATLEKVTHRNMEWKSEAFRREIPSWISQLSKIPLKFFFKPAENLVFVRAPRRNGGDYSFPIT
jgi:hypothetical protein